MSRPLPYGLESWVPVLRGGAAPLAVVHAEEGPEAARAAWSAVGPGARLALVGVGSLGGAERFAALEAALDGPHRLERFVALPGTGGGFVLLPTASAAALRAGLPLLPSGRRRWSAARLGLGALAPLAVARRLGLTEVAVVTRGDRLSAEDALVRDDEHCALAASVADGRQKVVARVITPAGEARSLVKLAHRPASSAAVLHERRGLELLREVAPELAPEVLDRGERGGRPWFTQELLAGQRSPDVFHEGHAAFLARLQAGTLARRTPAQIPALSAARDALALLAREDDPEWRAEMDALLAELEASDDDLPTWLAHGDFTSWNLAVGPHGMRAFDWEAFLEEAPGLYDVFHFHLQTGVLVHRRDALTLLRSLGDLLLGPARQLVEAAAMDTGEVVRALGLYVLHAATRDELSQRREPAPFVQVGWIRRARRDLARLVTGALRERRAPWSIPSPPASRARGERSAG